MHFPSSKYSHSSSFRKCPAVLHFPECPASHNIFVTRCSTLAILCHKVLYPTMLFGSPCHPTVLCVLPSHASQNGLGFTTFEFPQCIVVHYFLLPTMPRDTPRPTLHDDLYSSGRSPSHNALRLTTPVFPASASVDSVFAVASSVGSVRSCTAAVRWASCCTLVGRRTVTWRMASYTAAG